MAFFLSWFWLVFSPSLSSFLSFFISLTLISHRTRRYEISSFDSISKSCEKFCWRIQTINLLTWGGIRRAKNGAFCERETSKLLSICSFGVHCCSQAAHAIKRVLSNKSLKNISCYISRFLKTGKRRREISEEKSLPYEQAKSSSNAKP